MSPQTADNERNKKEVMIERETIKIERGVYPDFYVEREGIIEEDTPLFFSGREDWLKMSWDALSGHARRTTL